jgi:hypothetical protein
MSKEDTMTKELEEARERLAKVRDGASLASVYGWALPRDEFRVDLGILLSAPKGEVAPYGYAVEYDDGTSAFVRFDPTTPEGWPRRAIFPPTCKGYKITTVYRRAALSHTGGGDE